MSFRKLNAVLTAAVAVSAIVASAASVLASGGTCDGAGSGSSNTPLLVTMACSGVCFGADRCDTFVYQTLDGHGGASWNYSCACYDSNNNAYSVIGGKLCAFSATQTMTFVGTDEYGYAVYDFTSDVTCGKIDCSLECSDDTHTQTNEQGDTTWDSSCTCAP